MSNYNNKNPVWGNKPPMNQTNSLQPQLGGLGNLNHSGMVPFQQQQVFQNIGLNQQNLGLGLQQMAAATQLNASLASNPIFQQQLSAVTYPNPRGLNPTAFQTANVTSNLQNSGTATKQRVFTGTVTQIHDNFGFIDDEVFFPRNSVVKGSNPMVGDKVLVEAAFNSSMPFKWNATRVQVLQGGQQQQSRDVRGGGRDHSSGYNAVPPPSDAGNGFGRRGDVGRDIGRDRPKASVGDRRVRSRDRDDDEIERKRRREERVREREKEDKDRKSPVSVRRRSRSPKARRRTRNIPRYMVQIPKIALDLSQADVLEVKRRYNNLYIPSDFFNTYIRWVDAFPPSKPYTLNKPCSFHIMYKELDSVNENDAVLEPSDADYRFSAKVMLMSVPGVEEIYQKCFAMAEDKDKRERDSEDKDFVHPTRLINFLVGLRGKNETMAIGGPWSPSLDGENPENDPSVLIKTAIRSCKALTGIDLSNCTKWYRFVELYYRRSETTHKGKLVPARVETVVLFLPDVWSCLPTRLEWEDLQLSYRNHLEKILKANGSEDEEKSSGSDEKVEGAVEKLKPTHHSQLDPKTMVVLELRDELKARDLVITGLKSQLVARLTKALKAEAKKDEDEPEEKDDKEVVPDAEEDDKEEKDKKSEVSTEEKKLDEQQKRRLEKQYTLPDQSHLIVHPSKAAKSGKFDCTTMSLSLLLDYRPEDTKEHSFEVSLFAELFNEMLMRDFGFNIFKALYELPDKPKEKEEDKKKKDDKKDEKKDEKKSDDKKKDKKDDEKRDEKSSEKDKKSEERETRKDRNDDDKKKDKDSKKDDRRSESSEDDDDDDDRKDKKDKDSKKKDRVKLYTKNKHLLLSFVYFDTTQCGYIFDKDVEELLYTLGLNLSRSQVKKMVNKVIARDSLHYRKLTDKPKDEDKEKTENGDKPAEKPLDWKDMAWGNKRLLPIFDDETQSRNSKKDSGGNSTSKDGLVVYQGAVIDVGKLLSQLERSEKARIETEQHMVDLKSENHKITEKYSKSSSTIKHLTSEVKDYKEKLRSTEDTLGRTNAHAKLFQTTLMDIRDKIDPILKTASHKDKEDRKDRDRESDKKKEKDDSKSRWEKERESFKKESDKEKEARKEEFKKESKENKDDPKKEKEENRKDADKKGGDVKIEKEDDESQDAEDVMMNEEKKD